MGRGTQSCACDGWRRFRSGNGTHAKLGAKLSGSRGAIVASRARTSDGIVFYDYEFVSDDKMHELLSLCVHKGRLWQVSAKSPDRTWPKTSPLYRNAVGSFVPKL